jgi:hypothetical protein
MASPMRKKRAWSTLEEDDQSEETAAFEEAVAAARDSAAKSSEFLSSAKSDLTDHHRWLKAQGVAVDRDRARHERWLERQREQRMTVARKDRTRRRRQIFRQRASEATQRASEATQHAAGASVSYAGSMFVRAFANIGAGIKYVVLLIAGGFAFVGRSLRDGTLYTGRLIAAGLGWIAAKLKAFVFATGRMVGAAFTWSGSKAVASGRAGGEALSSGSAFVSSKTVSSARVGGSALAAGLALVSSKTASSVCAGGSVLAKGATFVSSKTHSSVCAAGKALATASAFIAAKTGSAARATGSALSAGSSFVSTKVQSSARASGSALAAGSTVIAAKAQSSARVSGSALATGSSLVASKADVFSKSAGRSLGTGFAAAGERASMIASKRRLSSGFAWSKAQGLKLASTVSVRVGKLGQHAGHYARASVALAKDGFKKAKALVPARGKANDPGTSAALHVALDEEVYGPFDEGFLVEGPSLNDPEAFVSGDVAPRVRSENPLSSWARERARDLWARGASVRDAWAEKPFVQSVRARTRDVELSQMMIIAGAVLLVCGGLLLGGGFILRAGAVPGGGTGAVVPEEVAEEEIHGVAWTFEDYDSPLPDRAVFTLSGTPEAFGINGLSISGTNRSDLPLTGVHAILKPDVQRPDLKLILQVDKSAAADDSGAQALDVVPANTVPAHAPFRLVFPFPPEAMDGEDGVAVEEFFDSYGGLLLKFQYEINGTQKSLIQYLTPELLRSQLDEVADETSGS